MDIGTCYIAQKKNCLYQVATFEQCQQRYVGRLYIPNILPCCRGKSQRRLTSNRRPPSAGPAHSPSEESVPPYLKQKAPERGAGAQSQRGVSAALPQTEGPRARGRRTVPARSQCRLTSNRRPPSAGPAHSPSEENTSRRPSVMDSFSVNATRDTLTLCHVTSRHVTSRHVTSRHVTSRHVMSR